MHILVDIRHLHRRLNGGVGEYTRQLLRTLFEIDQENRYTTLSTGWHVGLPNKLLNASILATRRPHLDRLIHHDSPPSLTFLPNLNFVSLSQGLPYVLTIHDLAWDLFPQFFSKKMRLWHTAVQPRRLIEKATQLIVPSRATKRDLCRRFAVDDQQVHVIPHGVDECFSPTFLSTDHGVRGKYKLPKRFALFVGTLEPRKNLHAIVDAVEAYRRASRDDFHLVLVGEWGWKSRELRRHILHPWLHHLGHIRAQDLPALYRAATVFLWPSMYEGFGLPVLESMACGTPVITSATSSLPEVAGNAAILVDPFNPGDITTALNELLSSHTLRERLCHAGREQAKKFSWKKTAEQTLEVFKMCG